MTLIGKILYQKGQKLTDIQKNTEVKEFYYTLFDIIENTVGYDYLINDECNIKVLIDNQEGTLYNSLIKEWKQRREQKTTKSIL